MVEVPTVWFNTRFMTDLRARCREPGPVVRENCDDNGGAANINPYGGTDAISMIYSRETKGSYFDLNSRRYETAYRGRCCENGWDTGTDSNIA